MSWNVELGAEKNPYDSPMQKCELGVHNAKIHSVKSENNEGPMMTKKGQPMTAVTLKVVGGISDGAYLTDYIFPESTDATLQRDHSESAIRYGKVCWIDGDYWTRFHYWSFG